MPEKLFQKRKHNTDFHKRVKSYLLQSHLKMF